MSRNSSQPECLPDTMVQTRAKRARIQSQRPLSPESALNFPSPLKEPLEVSVTTTSGFISKTKLKLQDFKVLELIFDIKKN